MNMNNNLIIIHTCNYYSHLIDTWCMIIALFDVTESNLIEQPVICHLHTNFTLLVSEKNKYLKKHNQFICNFTTKNYIDHLYMNCGPIESNNIVKSVGLDT